MAPELDMGMSLGMGMGTGLGLGLGMGMMPMGMVGMDAASSSFSTAYMCGLPSAEAMRIDDLLDFSNQDELFDAAAAAASAAAHENHQSHTHLLPLHDPPAVAGNPDASAPHLSTFSDDLYIPSEEAAELEWLSKFVDDSFSDVPFHPSHGGAEPVPSSNSGVLGADPSAVPARARSKRSRAPAAALHHSMSTWCSPPPPPLQPQSSSSTASSASSSSSSSEFPPGAPSSRPSKASAAAGSRKKEGGGAGVDGGVRRCTHCSSEKTPQWRTGPLGPKTLCNACGVRYKSGRLVPEYRPAASPTFVLTQHSNSHRKVMELRRQKELLLRQHAATVSNPGAAMSPSPRPELLFRDYEVC